MFPSELYELCLDPIFEKCLHAEGIFEEADSRATKFLDVVLLWESMVEAAVHVIFIEEDEKFTYSHRFEMLTTAIILLCDRSRHLRIDSTKASYVEETFRQAELALDDPEIAELPSVDELNAVTQAASQLVSKMIRIAIYDARQPWRKMAHPQFATDRAEALEKEQTAGEGKVAIHGSVDTGRPTLPDGPVNGFRWRNDGAVTEATMSTGAWRIANHLWNIDGKWSPYTDLAAVVADDAEGDILEAGNARGYRDRANKYLRAAGIPWKMVLKDRGMGLEQA